MSDLSMQTALWRYVFRRFWQPDALSLRFPMFLGLRRSGIDFCNAKTPTPREDTPFSGGYFIGSGARGEPLKEGYRTLETSTRPRTVTFDLHKRHKDSFTLPAVCPLKGAGGFFVL